MRVALVVRSFPQISETFIVSKFTGLLARGVDAHVVASGLNRDALDSFPELSTPAVARRIHVHRDLLPARPAAVARAARTFVTAPRAFIAPGNLRQRVVAAHAVAPLLRLAPDVVHFEFGTLAVGACGPLRRLGIPVVVSFRGFDVGFSGLEDPGFYDDVWRHAAAFHFLGDYLRRRALARGCPPDRPYRLIPPAVDIDRFPAMARTAARPTDARSLRVLSVGRLHWTKGYEWGLDALRLAAKGVPLQYRVVGDGEHRLAVAFARHQLGLDGVVELLGVLARPRVVEQLQWADLFLHPAVSEGFGNAVIEAQASGVPVVCTDAGGLVENVEHGETGVVVPRRDPISMAQAIIDLASDPERRVAMGAAGRPRVERLFTMDQQIDRFCELYRDVAASVA